MKSKQCFLVNLNFVVEKDILSKRKITGKKHIPIYAKQSKNIGFIFNVFDNVTCKIKLIIHTSKSKNISEDRVVNWFLFFLFNEKVNPMLIITHVIISTINVNKLPIYITLLSNSKNLIKYLSVIFDQLKPILDK